MVKQRTAITTYGVLWVVLNQFWVWYGQTQTLG